MQIKSTEKYYFTHITLAKIQKPYKILKWCSKFSLFPLEVIQKQQDKIIAKTKLHL